LSPNPTGVVDFNLNIVDEITLDKNMNRLRACIQCGECTAGCPSGRWTAMRTRRIIRRALTGMKAVLSDPEIWECTTCFTCYERCPRNIPVTDIIIAIRNIASREGYIQDAMKGIIKNLIETGHAVPIDDVNSNWAKLRVAHGLPPLPPTVLSFPSALNELQILVDLLRFKQRIPYK
jgi:heterodisulfide reductase subunit C2